MKYHNGLQVMIGDIVVTGNEKIGVVEKIFEVGSIEAQNYHCVEGGVLIREDWYGQSSFLVTSQDGDGWEDLDFRRREKAAETT